MGTTAARSPGADSHLPAEPSALECNRSYYEALYRPRHPLVFLLHGRISFDQQSKTRLNRQALWDFLRERKRAGRDVDVLDYGCGWGTLLLSLPRGGVRAHAHDLSRAALENLARSARLLGRAVERASLDDSGALLQGRYDAIVCSHVLEHVPSDTALLRELARALRPGGALLVNVPINERWPDPKHVRRYDEGRLRERLAEAGLEAVAVVEQDRITTALLDLEQGRPDRGLPGTVALRALRALLALLPLAALGLAERLLLRETPPHQLVVLAMRVSEAGRVG